MSIGPVEIVAIEFPEDWAPDAVRRQVTSLVEGGVVRIVDALLVAKDGDGTVTVVELEEAGGEVAALVDGLAQQLDLVSEEDAQDLGGQLEPGRRALILAFEHTWMLPVRDAVLASGGSVITDLHIPGPVVDEVLAGVAQV